MIFGSIINENLKNKIIVTVVATGFDALDIPSLNPSQTPSIDKVPKRRREIEKPMQQVYQQRREEVSPLSGFNRKVDDSLDTPAFLRNRKRRY